MLCELSVWLLAGGYVGQSLEDETRLYLFWGWSDTILLIGLLAAAGAVAAGFLHAAAALSKGRTDRWLSPLFYFLIVLFAANLFLGLRQRFVPAFPWLRPTVYYLVVWTLGALLTAGGMVWPRMGRMASKGWRVLSFLWPLLVLLPYSLATARNWGGRTVDDPGRLGRNADGRGAPLVVLILDMVAYDDAFDEAGAVRKELPNLAGFAETAMVFHRAKSGGYYTGSALPGLMFQEEVGHPVLQKDAVRWRRRADPAAPLRRADEFERALPLRYRKAGGRAVYVGCYFPYRVIMPGLWDVAASHSVYGAEFARPTPDGLAAALRHLAGYLNIAKDPVSAVLKTRDVSGRLRRNYWRRITRDIVSDGRRWIRDGLSPGDLLIVHLTVPHEPFVFDAEGTPVEPPRQPPGAYREQLRYADRLFGDLTDELKRSGKWDGSWVVMLSDHGPHFRDWGENWDDKRHVPFMAKAPGQTERKDLHDPIPETDFTRIPGFPPAEFPPPSDSDR